VITPFLELYDGVAPVAALPTFLAGLFEEPVRLHVAGAGSRIVPSTVAGAADLGLAAAAFPVVETGIAADVLGSNPLTAVRCGTVEPVARRVLGELLVPLPLEVVVKESLDMLQGNMVSGTASRGHMLRVGEGKLKVPS